MDSLLDFFLQHVNWAPYIIFGLLMLTGLHLPVSEDGMIFIAAVLASSHPDLLIKLYLAVYLGAFLSDIICYSIGKILGPRLWKVPFFAKRLKRQQVKKVHSFYERFGLLTLIIGRFIPFGIRNVLTFTAGISKMNVLKFIISDAIACLVSCSTFFLLYYSYGERMINYVKQANIIIFIFAVSCVLTAIVFYRRKKAKISD